MAAIDGTRSDRSTHRRRHASPTAGRRRPDDPGFASGRSRRAPASTPWHGMSRRLGATSVFVALALVLVFVGTSARAQATLTVPGSHATIQAAINAASTGDTILVAAGLYAERIDYLGKGLSIVGAGVGQSILDGQMQGSVVTIANSEPLGTRIEGFTIRNGLGSLFQLDPASNPLSLGGGIAVVGYSPIPQPLPNLEVKNCRIENCALQGSVLYGGGGGIGVHRAMKVSNVDDDIIRFCAAANPLNWTLEGNAGYLPDTGRRCAS